MVSPDPPRRTPPPVAVASCLRLRSSRRTQPMAPNRIVGIVLLVVGCILLAFAYQGSQSIGDQAKQAVTGEFRERTTLMFVAGGASAVAGLIALLIPGSRLGKGYA